MATQTGGLIATLDPAIYAAQVAEEAFIDAFQGRGLRRILAGGIGGRRYPMMSTTRVSP